MGGAGTIRRAADALLAVLLAPRCAACDRPLDEPTRGAICAGCWAAILPSTPPCCIRCGEPLPSWRVISQQAACCPRCRRSPGVIMRGGAIGPYDGALRAIIHALKYGGRRSLARPLAALMRRHAAPVLDGADLIVPVPLHPSRRRSRGFNQAADLAAHLGLPVADALRRVRRTPPQTGLPACRRHRNVRDAFAPRAPWRLPGSLWGSSRGGVQDTCVVLVDDVRTTGATLEACARALAAAGAREVRALTAARAVTGRRPPPPRRSPP